ncbi:MAG: DUF2804 domain-containing protein [Solirubrobacterales bacterium]
MLRRGRLRKQWRYVAVFGPDVMLCAGTVRIGPACQEFWAVWDRLTQTLHERTRTLIPGMRPAVVVAPGRVAIAAAPEVDLDVRLGARTAIESVCPSGPRGFGWTRKRADIPVTGSLAIGGRPRPLRGRAVEDVSAGYHARHVEWWWSAGIGRSADGRSVGWNLVQGINDPERDSERAVWLDGRPQEPGRVRFDGLRAIASADGTALTFSAEAERARDDRVGPIRSAYRQPFGTFSGRLAGIELDHGIGVMEHHDVRW